MFYFEHEELWSRAWRWKSVLLRLCLIILGDLVWCHFQDRKVLGIFYWVCSYGEQLITNKYLKFLSLMWEILLIDYLHPICWLVISLLIVLWFPPAVAVSRDHKPDQSDERQRIEDAGGFVMWAGKVLTYWPSRFLVTWWIARLLLSETDIIRYVESWRSSCCFSCFWW